MKPMLLATLLLATTGVAQVVLTPACGTVIDDRGRPLAGLEVEFVCRGATGPEGSKSVTDLGGLFQVPLPVRSGTVVAATVREADGDKALLFSGPVAVSSDGVYLQVQSLKSLHGQVDCPGQDLTDATIRVTFADPGVANSDVAFKGVVNRDGRFRVETRAAYPDHEALVEVRKLGLGYWSRFVDPAQLAIGAEIALTSRQLTFQVIRSDGSPGGSLRFGLVGEKLCGFMPGTTDEDGRATLLVDAQRGEVFVSNESGLVTRRAFDAVAGDCELTLRFPSATSETRVRAETASGEPIEGVAVFAVPYSRDLPFDAMTLLFPGVLKTDHNGTCSAAVSDDILPMAVFTSSAKFGVSPVAVVRKPLPELTIVHKVRSIPISFDLVVGHYPVYPFAWGPVLIWLQAADGRAQGYSLYDVVVGVIRVHEGDYHVHAVLPGGRLIGSTRISVREGSRRRFSITLSDAVVVTGRVTDSESRVVGGQRVVVWREGRPSARPWEKSATRADGGFELFLEPGLHGKSIRIASYSTLSAAIDEGSCRGGAAVQWAGDGGAASIVLESNPDWGGR